MNLAGKPNFANRYTILNKARRRKRLALVGVALFCVVVLTTMIMSLNTTKATADKANDLNITQTESIQSVSTRNAIVPSKDINAGQQFKSEDLEQIVISKDAVAPDAIYEKSEAIGAYATILIRKGEHIKKTNLTLENAKREVLNITPGMRAVTVEVDARRGIEGWALPGTRVDVVLTYMNEGELTSKIVVENTRVLSNAGDSQTKANEQGNTVSKQISGKSTVTLETTPKDALKIETSQQKGTLSLHMRSQDDTKTSGVESYSENDLEKSDEVENLDKPKKQKKDKCTKGKMKIDGVEYLVDCNGQVIKDF